MPSDTTTATTPKRPTKAATAGSAAGRRAKPDAARRARAAAPAVTHEAIARRAFELFEGGHPGDHLEHWLDAERQLRARA